MGITVLLQKSNEGNVSLYDRRDKFHASFKNGSWSNDLLFSAYELEEFDLIDDECEIARVLAEARAALNQPLKELSDDRTKSV
ncbi:MAG: hypothetical protein IT343_11300 [Candidatus Melainabacteria bacterium]|jgi:hypothetical protein|nr:hypothetical protein [Candidatus Melainabacteria bacterium]